MAKARKVYIDPQTNKYYALFVGENVKSFLVEDTFPSGDIRITHGQDSMAVIPRLYSSENEELWPTEFSIIDENEIEISFLEPFTGKIKLLFFDN